LRFLLVEAAQVMVRSDPRWRSIEAQRLKVIAWMRKIAGTVQIKRIVLWFSLFLKPSMNANSTCIGSEVNFNAANAIGIVNQQGKFVMFTWDWQGALGVDSGSDGFRFVADSLRLIDTMCGEGRDQCKPPAGFSGSEFRNVHLDHMNER
jgi:hypothetical protein